jgi:hypothetical protein
MHVFQDCGGVGRTDSKYDSLRFCAPDFGWARRQIIIIIEPSDQPSGVRTAAIPSNIRAEIRGL